MASTRFPERFKLPVYAFKTRFLDALAKNRVVIVEGETGSGKTTQIPQWLLEDGYPFSGGSVAVTQPRRIAAVSVATRVSKEMGVPLGSDVGYSVRFDTRTSPSTRLLFLTDGMLLREAAAAGLGAYSVVVIDEAHERTLATDILLGKLQAELRERPALRVVLMSATVNTAEFRDFFSSVGAPVLTVPGRLFPVDVRHRARPVENYVSAAVGTVLSIHRARAPGDVLVFLTGAREIEAAIAQLRRRLLEEDPEQALGAVLALPLYSSLPLDEQARVFEAVPEADPPTRKVVVATNIAETSLTIDGIVFVVDCGFSKLKIYRHEEDSESLTVHPISQASAQQRAGRAGRTRPGLCYRLYPESAMKKEMPKFTPPEMQRSKLSSVILSLFSIGAGDILEFDFISPPEPAVMESALRELLLLGAVRLTDAVGPRALELTDKGQLMTLFPLDPELSAMLIASVAHGCSNEAAALCALLSVTGQVFFMPPGRDEQERARAAHAALSHPTGDHLTLLNVLLGFSRKIRAGGEAAARQWAFDNYLSHRALSEALRITRQLREIMEDSGIPLVSPRTDDEAQFATAVRKAVLSGLFMRLAVRGDGIAERLTTSRGCPVRIHPSSVLHGAAPKWILYTRYLVTAGSRGDVAERIDSVMGASEINPGWIFDVCPQIMDALEDTPFRAALRRVELRRRAFEGLSTGIPAKRGAPF
eukprot:gnl/Chilomastix_cuspidata/4236.p1 GENE.gnl/Chilomastix_cuspidata/4236~~gnl/Chilomastix_cuspidata/4236.p1  ORF type:complete len:704 (-),score=256.84 gnl/Chilomastix_cuspidata/4236:230-2341(-)